MSKIQFKFKTVTKSKILCGTFILKKEEAVQFSSNMARTPDHLVKVNQPKV